MSTVKFHEIYSSLYKNILEHSKNLDLFISQNENLSEFYKTAVKSLSDYSTIQDNISDYSTIQDNISSNLFLPELLINNFDVEQIWQQVDLRVKNINSLREEVMLPFSLNLNKRSGDLDQNSNKKVRFSDVKYDDDSDLSSNHDNDELEEDLDNNLNEINGENEPIFQEGIDSDIEEDENLKKVLATYRQKLGQEETRIDSDINDNVDDNDDISNNEDDDNNGDVQELIESSDDDANNDYGDPLARLKDAIENSKSKNAGSENLSKVEDRFLNLKQMEDFVKDAEKKREEISEDEMSDDDLSEDESNVKYEDFFNEDSSEKSEKKILLDSDDSDGKENLKETRELIRDTSDELSALEKRSLTMQKRIHELEEDNLAAKPWQMKGEISAKLRPENSLLSEVLEFDTTTKPAPLITEEVSKTIEDKIIERLKSNVWDGPKRKVKVKESEFTLKKKIVLDQEKSKISLEQIYENEYLQQNEKDEKEPEEFEAIRKSMTSLFMKLDALSNFHYTPKPAIPDLKIISNIPAITVEEAIPVAISNAMLLAPQEILEKRKGELVGASELSKTDKLRARRSKKRRQHFKRLDKDRKDMIKKNKTDKNNILKNLKADLNINEHIDKKRNSKKTKKTNKKTK